ncbi:MAG: hybrid sensor histidine kinase/response regulator [Thermoanaerobaculaceae bacterium]|nr:hybrid sensor histidine kinase/response regulator [Thermoanaerobaculaceae bacterium]TAM53589.1 MAG: hybrid sensor histidine kinase/response regulator [Acidobacteriota bacterium]
MDGTILYVDDDESNLTVLEAACAPEFTVLTASSAEAAMEILRRQEVAVLLVDQRMPGMSGVEFFEATREDFPDTVRLLITAYSDLTDAVNAINRGQVRGYIRKPWEPEELKATLRGAIEIHETRHKVHELEQRLLDVERVYALGVAAAGVAHELRTPLQTLTTSLELAGLRIANLVAALERETPQKEEQVAAGRSAADRIGAARHAVAQMAEITSGIELSNRRREDETSSDLKDVLKLSLRAVRAEVAKRAQIQVEIEPGPPVEGSPNKLGQVVMNLLINALQALPDRPRGENLVMVRLRRSGGCMRIEIEDNGTGIQKDVIDRIFDPFFTTKRRGGTGLGLAISKQIVEELHGRIGVESEPGRWTRFTVELPFAGSAPASPRSS